MPYREKIVWLSLFAIAVAFIPYFTYVAITPTASEGLPNVRQLILYAIAAGVQMSILLGGRMWLAARSPEDAKIPADERDQAISRNAIRASYFVLMAGTILVGVVMPFTHSGWQIVNAALFMIVLAEVVNYSIAAISYRRQA
jgi:predicted type IV restriction endonuclease